MKYLDLDDEARIGVNFIGEDEIEVQWYAKWCLTPTKIGELEHWKRSEFEKEYEIDLTILTLI